MSRRDVDEFLDRADALLEAPQPLTACAWCSHPITDASPSPEFCKESCADDWRQFGSLALVPRSAQCRCRGCDPEGWDAWAQRYPNRVNPRYVSELATQYIDVWANPPQSGGWVDIGTVTSESITFTTTNAYDVEINWRDPLPRTVELSTGATAAMWRALYPDDPTPPTETGES